MYRATEGRNDAAVFRRRRRVVDLRKRIAERRTDYQRCRVYPCTNLTTAHSGEGLNRLYCRRHIEFFRRHGSYVKRSYGAGEFRPYRDQAMRWLLANGEDHAVQLAANAVRRRYTSAGAAVEAFRVTGKPPSERAAVLWARLRERKVDPLAVVAAWLAVDRMLSTDPQKDRHDEYRHVQVAKLIHRMAGGTHKRWEVERADGRVKVTETPQASGQPWARPASDRPRCCEGVRRSCRATGGRMTSPQSELHEWRNAKVETVRVKAREDTQRVATARRIRDAVCRAQARGA